MNSNTQQKFREAMNECKRGDNFVEEGNYGYAAKCYLNVSKILKILLESTQNQKSANDLRQKVQKYICLADKYRNMDQSKTRKKVVISKLGFPEQKKKQISLLFPKTQTINQSYKVKSQTDIRNHNKSVRVDPVVQGLIDRNLKHSFQDIIGMQTVKEQLYEAVICPQKRPDIFIGIRAPPRGILLYGPPGNGKTYIVKALAKQSGCVFYGLSAGTILNKFVGQSQKMLKKIFEAAKQTRPSIIFIDEIDSIITARTQNENESSRRFKTQFLIQFDSLQPNSGVILIGATNFPGQLDMAALRRFNKLIFIGLPQKEARQGIIRKCLGKQINFEISNKQMSKIVKYLQGYTASQITDIVKQASMLPVRQIKVDMMLSISKNKIRPVNYDDFSKTIKLRKPLMSKEELKKYEKRFNE